MPKLPPPKIATCAVELVPADGAVLLLPDGEFRAKDGRPVECASWRLTPDIAARLIAQCAARKLPTAVDYEHALVRSKKEAAEAPAAGWWGNGLEYRPGQGLYATGIEWTERAAQMIAAKEYRYVSPVFAYSDTTGDVLALLNFSLTNDPALEQLDELTLAAASAFFDPQPEPHPPEPPMEKELLERLRCVLNLPTASTAADISTELTKVQGIIAQMQTEGGATVGLAALLEQAQAKIATLSAQTPTVPDPAKFVPVAVVTGLQGQLAALTARLDGQDKEALIKRGLEAGQIFAGDHETWARSLDVAALSAFLTTAPKIAALAGSQTGGKPPAAADGKTIDDRAKTEWGEKTAALSAEFGDYETYLAYRRAEEGGKVKLLGGKQ